MAKGNKIEIDVEALCRQIFTGIVSPYNLPHPIYFQTADILKKPLYKAFGGDLSKHKFNSPDYKLLKELRSNIYIFSAAKTFQEVNEVSKEIVKGDKIVPFKEFKAKATEILGLYNEQYLAAEHDTAEMMARAASKWNKIQSEKEIFPYLRYSDVEDSHECEICGGLHGVVARADDSFWDDFMPPNHFFCRCVVEQLEEGEDAESGELGDIADEARERMKDQDNGLFLMNPGKDKVIYKDEGKEKHPYFDIEPRFAKLAGNNFNLPLPDTD